MSLAGFEPTDSLALPPLVKMLSQSHLRRTAKRSLFVSHTPQRQVILVTVPLLLFFVLLHGISRFSETFSETLFSNVRELRDNLPVDPQHIVALSLIGCWCVRATSSDSSINYGYHFLPSSLCLWLYYVLTLDNDHTAMDIHNHTQSRLLFVCTSIQFLRHILGTSHSPLAVYQSRNPYFGSQIRQVRIFHALLGTLIAAA